VTVRWCGEAVIERVDEDHAAVLELADIVDVEFARHRDVARHMAGVEDVVDLRPKPTTLASSTSLPRDSRPQLHSEFIAVEESCGEWGD